MNNLTCRSCLAMDVKLYYVENELFSAYQNILGKQIPMNTVQYVCSMCGTLILKFMKFRQQCLAADILMQEITQHHLKDIETPLNKFNNLIKSETLNVNYEPRETFHMNFNKNDLKNDFENASNDNECLTVFKSEDDDDDKTLIEFKNELEIGNTKQNELITNFVFVKNEINTESNMKTKPKTRKSQKVKEVKRKKKFDDLKVKRYDNPEGREYFEKTYDVEIIVLTKNEQVEEFSLRKTSKSYLQANYKCDRCYKGFLNEVMYKNHLNAFHDETTSKFICEVCNIRYRRTKYLRRHQSMHKLKFVCKKCDFVSRCCGQARLHYKYHAGHKYTCKYCHRSFGKSTTYLSHVRLVHPAKLPSCQTCGEAFIGDVGLYQHMRRAHPEIVQHKCQYCKFEFQTEEALRTHVSKQIDNKCASDFCPCKHCGESYENKELLMKHFDDAHKRNIQTYPCELCNTNFSNTMSLEKHHQRVHLIVEPKRRKCRQEVRDANKPDTEVKRKQSFHELCEVCGKICTQYSTLRYHQTLHAGVKPFKCEVCLKSYLTALLLKIHSRIHSSNKSYECEVCRKGFHNWSNLKRHQLIHTGERPYPCEICGKSFQQSSNLKLHVQTVHMKIPQKPRIRNRKKTKETDKPY